MSGMYRVEISPNNRATCSTAECKKMGSKLMKGEIRQGVTVAFQEHTSMKWRHWGCVTPAVLHNWMETAGGDMELIDGYDALPAEAQEKVKRALEQGHVDDEEWNGDIEMNRYNPDKPRQGMFLTQAERKKRDKAEAAANGEDEAPAKKKKTTKKRKPADDNDDDEVEEKPAPKKARGKKAKAEEADQEDEAPPAKKPRGKKAKDEGDVEAAPAKKKPGRKPKAKTPETSDDVEPEENEAPVSKPATKKSKAKKADVDSDEPLPKPQKRKAKAKKAAVEDDEE